MRRLALAAFILLVSIAPARAQTPAITLVGDEWCPYVCGGDPAKPGILVEIARQAFTQNGIAFDYKTIPWARAVKETREGKYTAVLGALHENASDLIFPQTPQAQSVATFYVKRGTPWKYYGVSDLSRVSLGVISDYAYDPSLDEYILHNVKDFRRIQPVAGQQALASNVKKLLIGRVDAVVEMATVMDYYLGTQNLRKDIIPAGRMSESQDVFIAFSPKDKEARRYADMIGAATEQLTLSGGMNALLARYNTTPAGPAEAP